MRLSHFSRIPQILILILFLSAYSISQEQIAAPKPLDVQAIDEWNSIRSAEVSNNGTWFAYYLTPNDGDSKIIVKSLKDTLQYIFDAGKTTAGRLSFSDDSEWLVFTKYPAASEQEKAQKANNPIQNKAVLLNLKTGKETEFDKIQSFAFSGENSGWIAMSRYSDKKGKDAPKGSDLILRDLEEEKQFNFGNVSDFKFNQSGDWLALAIDAQDMAGNGIWLHSMDTGRLYVMDSDTAVYERLNWTEKGDGLTLLKGKKHADYENRLYELLAFSHFSKSSPVKTVFKPADFENFPDDFTISPNRSAEWTEDLTGLSFGIHDAGLTREAREKRLKKESETEEDQKEGKRVKAKDEKPDIPDLVIWHWKDKRLQSQQWVQERQDKNYSYLSFYSLAGNQFTRLADDDVRRVIIAPKEKHALGYDHERYQPLSNLDGRLYHDVYVYDLETGKREKILEKIRWTYDISPDGKYLLYYKDGHFHTVDLYSKGHANITKDAPVSFIDMEDDHNVIDPPTRPQGWASDGRSVILTDNWDLWRVPVQRGRAVNLTVNGREDGIRYQRRFRLDADEKGIDFSKPQYFRMYGEYDKKGGIARIDRGRPGAEVLLWDDAQFNALMKAENAPVYLYTRETVSEFPDYFSSGADLKTAEKRTDANPQQSEYAWCPGYRIINYENDRGEKLQGILYLPAGYEEGKSYPAVVYMYEKLSQNANRYPMPRLWVGQHTFHTSNGYAVLNPDVTFAVNDPGISSAGCILPALDAAIETGIVDADNVGIHGHSWGGYQTAFIITQTDRFKAAIAGAPLTNMISMYSSIYWNTGGANMSIFESRQGRFYGGFWDNLEAYQRNSPVYYARNVNTPLLMLHNDKDGAVDYNQGIEYYSTLRRLKKPVVMLEYKGENHGLRKPENLKDYLWRIKQYFDYHLKGCEAPDWWSAGVNYIELEDHLKEQIKLYTRKDAPEKPADTGTE